MFKNVNKVRKMATIEWENDDGEEVHTLVPITFEVCHECGGAGSHCNRNIDGNGLTQEDLAEDPDFAEDYFSGRYDVVCEVCHGDRVIACISEAVELTEEQSEAIAYMERSAQYDAEDAHTRRMERGGW